MVTLPTNLIHPPSLSRAPRVPSAKRYLYFITLESIHGHVATTHNTATMRLSIFAACAVATLATAAQEHQEPLHDAPHTNRTVSPELFAELEELSRLVDISYCVGMTGIGISKPFKCLSRCSEFENFELITAWNTGPLLSDSCGYIAVSHAPSPPRILLAFRGTYSITNTLADLSTVPQEYVPYPGDDDENPQPPTDTPACPNCTVHTGFYTSWLNTRHEILPTVLDTMALYPNHTLTLVGHSLGGAVAALASLDFLARGWNPIVTTFGEPRTGNAAFAQYFDARFNLTAGVPADDTQLRFRRVTHANDPVPLLPLDEWGYVMHGGEIYISKGDLPPENSDVVHCDGAEDPNCITGGAGAEAQLIEAQADAAIEAETLRDEQSMPDEESELAVKELRRRWWGEDLVSPRYRLWQLFFAHRDYFWRLGLCVPEIAWWDRPKEVAQ